MRIPGWAKFETVISARATRKSAIRKLLVADFYEMIAVARVIYRYRHCYKIRERSAGGRYISWSQRQFAFPVRLREAMSSMPPCRCQCWTMMTGTQASRHAPGGIDCVFRSHRGRGVPGTWCPARCQNGRDACRSNFCATQLLLAARSRSIINCRPNSRLS